METNRFFFGAWDTSESVPGMVGLSLKGWTWGVWSVKFLAREPLTMVQIFPQTSILNLMRNAPWWCPLDSSGQKV